MRTLLRKKDLYSKIIAVVLGLFVSQQTLAVYQAVFNIKDDKGRQIVTEKDLKCVSVDDDNIVTFVLKESAAQHLYDFSKKNINKYVWVSICAVPPRKTWIESEIPGGVFEYASLTRYQKKCIRETFDIKKTCRPEEF